MDSKVVLIAAIALFAVAAAVVLLLPGSGDGPVPEVESVPASLVGTPAATDASAEPSGGAATMPASAPQSASRVASEVKATSGRRIVATYFHNTTRCTTCRTIEERAWETIETVFATDLASGRLVWRVLNMELGENEHYAYAYELTSPSLVLTEMDGDREVRFKVLDAVWRLIHAKVQFASYIESEVLAYLEGI